MNPAYQFLAIGCLLGLQHNMQVILLALNFCLNVSGSEFFVHQGGNGLGISLAGKLQKIGRIHGDNRGGNSCNKQEAIAEFQLGYY